MNIAILGSGNVGSALGTGWAKAGHQIKLGVRDTGELSAARLLEPVAMLWIHLAYRSGFGRNFAFKLLRR
jgi:predicted dinucleotide-binding enzyme